MHVAFHNYCNKTFLNFVKLLQPKVIFIPVSLKENDEVQSQLDLLAYVYICQLAFAGVQLSSRGRPKK